MKRIVLFLLTMLSILFSATSFAHTMPESEMFLRGIGPKTTLAQVKTVYGEPASKDVVKDKNITTPSGFSVGMPYQAVVKKFGPGEKFKDYNGRIGYIYGFNNDVKTLTFYVDKEDKISEINLGTDF